jgi:cobalt/nickel transport system permease protein
VTVLFRQTRTAGGDHDDPVGIPRGNIPTHMHIPDGVLPVWLWVSGLVLMVLVLAICLYRLRGMDMKVKIPLLGALSAVMLVAMNLEILPIAYHINLSVVTGILLGPELGFTAAFLTNLILALLGHGGITVMGLNTLLLGSETVLGHALFYVLPLRMPVFWRAAGATAITLFLTTGMLIGVVAVSHLDITLFSHGAEHSGHPSGEGRVGRFAAMVLLLGSLGWLLESVITGVVVRFISQIKPELLRHRLHGEGR